MDLCGEDLHVGIANRERLAVLLKNFSMLESNTIIFIYLKNLAF